MISIARGLSRGRQRCCPLINRISTPIPYNHAKQSSATFSEIANKSAKISPARSVKIQNTTPTSTSVSFSSASQSARTPKASSNSQATKKSELDPHEIASNMVRDASDTRISGTEALASVSREAKLRNYATATALVGFCTSVWWYSIQSVGKAEGGIEDLEAEANEAREGKAEKELSEEKMEELAGLDVTMNQMAGDMEGVEVAVAAEAEIAQMEEDLNNVTGGTSGVGKKPLWKKVVFFWKRD